MTISLIKLQNTFTQRRVKTEAKLWMKCHKTRDEHWVPLFAMLRELVENISVICICCGKDVIRKSVQPLVQ